MAQSEPPGVNADVKGSFRAHILSNSENGALPLRVYIWGGVMLVLGLANIAYLIFKPDFEPFIVLFFYSVPANTAISVFPHEPMVIYFGKYYNLLYVSLVSMLSTLVAAYLDHTVFTPVLNYPKFTGYRNNTVYKKAIYYFNKSPFWTIVVAAFSPVPFWPVKMLAFSNNYSMIRYLSAVTVGRLPRYYLLAAFGEIMQLPDWAIWILFIAIFMYAGVNILRKKFGFAKNSTPAG